MEGGQILLVLLGAAALLGLYLFTRTGGAEKREAERRDAALDAFRKTHERVRKSRAGEAGDDAPDPGRMADQIDRWADEDGRKAADTVRHLMDK